MYSKEFAKYLESVIPEFQEIKKVPNSKDHFIYVNKVWINGKLSNTSNLHMGYIVSQNGIMVDVGNIGIITEKHLPQYRYKMNELLSNFLSQQREEKINVINETK